MTSEQQKNTQNSGQSATEQSGCCSDEWKLIQCGEIIARYNLLSEAIGSVSRLLDSGELSLVEEIMVVRGEAYFIRQRPRVDVVLEDLEGDEMSQIEWRKRVAAEADSDAPEVVDEPAEVSGESESVADAQVDADESAEVDEPVEASVESESVADDTTVENRSDGEQSFQY